MFIENFKFVRRYFGLVTLKTQGNCFDITSLRPHDLNQFLVTSKEQIFGNFPIVSRWPFPASDI